MKIFENLKILPFKLRFLPKFSSNFERVMWCGRFGFVFIYRPFVACFSCIVPTQIVCLLQKAIQDIIYLDTLSSSVAPGPLAKWSVKADNGDLCILASFTGRFHVDYTATNQKTNTTFNTSAIVEIPESGVNVDTSRSFCDTYTLTENQQITLYWLDHSYRFNLTLKFNHDVNNTQNTEISWVALEYDLDDRALFPEATPTVNNLRTAESSAEVGTISHGMYLKCDSGVPVSLVDKEDPERSVDGVMFGVKVEAFRNSKTSTFDDHPEVCPGDAGNVTTPSPPHTTTPWPINMPRYEVFFPENGTACLLATFDLGKWWLERFQGKFYQKRFEIF